MNINEKKLNTALIIGRWQPWHKGHRELFKAALDKTATTETLSMVDMPTTAKKKRRRKKKKSNK